MIRRPTGLPTGRQHMNLLRNTDSRLHRLLLAAACVLSAAAWPAVGQTDSGPTQQRLPWRAWTAPDPEVNSVVQVYSDIFWPPAFNGTGSIVAKCTPNGIGWLIVLTADHVVRGGTQHRISFGDNAAQGYAGSAATSFYVSRSPPGTRDADLALLMVRYGVPDAFFDSIVPLTYRADPWVALDFTEVGYGGTGTFVAGGMNGGAVDGCKRFQNNYESALVTVSVADYNYTAVRWTFDVAPASIQPYPFLCGEGLSFAGDSGGPYFRAVPTLQSVPPMVRPGANNWPDGSGYNLMVYLCDGIGAVHTMGNSVYLGFNPYGSTWGQGAILTDTYVAWIDSTIHGFCCPAPLPCYANCDNSTAAPVLNVADFTCFLQKYANGDPYANCDGSLVPPLLNVADFTCFLQKYANGCP
jgi:hypothetical protein